jgi:carboxyl-terminal processing protease
MTLKQIRNFILSIALLLLAGGVGYWFGGHDIRISNFSLKVSGKGVTLPQAEVINKFTPQDKSDVDFSLFWEVWDRVEKSYLEKKDIDPRKMVYGAISGMVASLGDPYTVFLPPTDNQTSKEDLNGSFDGVGIQLGYKNSNQLAVVAPLSGMPAEKAGVKAGDLILHIKDTVKGLDQDTTGVSLPEAVQLIRGPKGSKVTLTFLHDGESKPFTVDLARETIVIPSVEVKFGTLVDGKWQEISQDKEINKASLVAWLKLTRFGDLTNQQWDEAVAKIIQRCQAEQNGQCAGLVLDLRNNPGGYLDGAVNLAGEFLDEGKLVVKQQNSDGTTQEYSVNRIGRLTSIPMVVLINGGSASASEILTGALRDQGRARVIGEKSFGKGTVQEAMDLRGGAGLHVTVAKWLLPKGEWIQKEGIKPEIEVALDEKDQTRDTQLEKAAEVLLK